MNSRYRDDRCRASKRNKNRFYCSRPPLRHVGKQGIKRLETLRLYCYKEKQPCETATKKSTYHPMICCLAHVNPLLSFNAYDRFFALVGNFSNPKIIPIAILIAINEVPPWLKNGRGIPVNGSNPIAAPIFSKI